jgi:hypothetical protein
VQIGAFAQAGREFSFIVFGLLLLPGVITPKPSHGRGENRCAMFRVVGTSTHYQLIVVAFEGQGSGHSAIAARPIKLGELSRQTVLGSILKEYAKRLHVRLRIISG